MAPLPREAGFEEDPVSEAVRAVPMRGPQPADPPALPQLRAQPATSQLPEQGTWIPPGLSQAFRVEKVFFHHPTLPKAGELPRIVYAVLRLPVLILVVPLSERC